MSAAARKRDDVVQALNAIWEKRGVTKLLFCDNGWEFTSQIMDLWAHHNRVQMAGLQGGSAFPEVDTP